MIINVPNGEEIQKEVKQLSDQLSTFSFKVEDGKKKVSTDGGQTWENFNSGAELLWTNPAPTSNFSAQTVSLDFSKYDSVGIEFANNTADLTTYFYSSPTQIDNISFDYRTASGYRNTSILSNGVAFARGAYGSGTIDNSKAIPFKIYGINKENL